MSALASLVVARTARSYDTFFWFILEVALFLQPERQNFKFLNEHYLVIHLIQIALTCPLKKKKLLGHA